MGHSARPVRPSLTLRDVFGPEPVYNPRASFANFDWLPEDRLPEPATGGVLPVAGGTPTICSAAAATPAGLDLLAEAGLPDPGPRLIYTDRAEYGRRIAEVVAEGRPIVVQHLHRPAEIPADAHWVPRELLAYLNNKGNLAELVPARAVPPRKLIAPMELFELTGKPSCLPLAVKAASGRTSGGGGGVVLARSPDDLYRAARKFAGCRHVVVEEFLDFQESFCLNFAATADRQIRYLGAGEQIVTEAGGYRGNWFGHDCRLPAEAVELGREIMHRAADRGYRGFAGFDAAVLPDGGVKVFDLNFRLNGSTKGLFYYDGVQQAFGAPAVSLLCGLRGEGSFTEMCDAARGALHRGVFVPLSTYDPAAVAGCPGSPAVSGLLLGESRRDVLAELSRFAGQGLASKLAAPSADQALRQRCAA